jgi:beta-1,4-mannosyltransferase
MKVVDMFGCKLPVCAIGFDCLKELVEHEKNGMIFKNSRELAEQLHKLLKGFPKNTEKLEVLRSNIRMNSWKDEWSRNALPVLI